MKNIKKLIVLPLKKYILTQTKCLFYMIVYTISSLMFPSFVSYIIDEGVVKNDIGKITLYSLLMLLTGALMLLFHYLQQVSFYKFSQEIIANLKESIFRKLLKTNNKFWNENTVGDIFSVLEKDIDRLENLLTSTISQIFVNFFVATGIAVYLIYMNYEIGIIVILCGILFAVIQRVTGNKAERITKTMRENLGKLTSFTNEALNNINSIQVSGYSNNIETKYNYRNRAVISSFIQQIRIMNLSSCLGLGFNVIGIFVVLIIGAYSVFEGNLSIGILFTLTIYVQRLYSPIISLGNAYVSIKNSKPIIEKIVSVIDNPDIIRDGDIIPEDSLKGNIEFQNITFSYDSTNNLYDNFNLKIDSGDVVGIVGENGSGKTTLVKLLTKLCEPKSGCIYMDQMNLNDLNVEYLRKQIGYMTQNEFIMSGSLREVIDPNNKFLDDEIIKSMEKFHLKINSFSEGLDTHIKENKNNMSGGEVQKIALVRLFLEDKPIYILDEPTAALDYESEEDICKLLHILLKDKTAIIITHRKCILKICTKVIKLG